MADIEFVYAHNTELEEAKAGIKELVDDFLKSKGSLVKKADWNGDGTRCDFEGKGFSGFFEVDQRQVRLELSLGFLLKGLKGRIRSDLESKIKARFPNGEVISNT